MIRTLLAFVLAMPLNVMFCVNGEFFWLLPVIGLQLLAGLNFKLGR